MPGSKPLAKSPGPGVVGVVVAGGRSERFGGPPPKPFRDLAGETLLARAVRAVASHPGVSGVVVVIPEDLVEGEHAVAAARLPGVLRLVPGGPTRAASVRRGVGAAVSASHVLVHDAARPLASGALVDAVLAATLRHGAAIPALPIPDTVKEEDAEGFVARTLDRSTLRLAQTPQGSRTDWLVDALDLAEREGWEVTDEASALERAGRRVFLVPGDPQNVKITVPEDLDEARRRLLGPADDLRVGTGYDVHRVEPERPLVLGGVSFPGEPGLAGHSDADVVLHAAMDALLGPAGLGDIGLHFPPDDPRFAGAASTDLARQVARLLALGGFEVVNLDLTILAERPRIRQRADEIRAAVASCLGIGADRVGLKATTLERLGALGRGEGIACQAVALLRRRAGRA